MKVQNLTKFPQEKNDTALCSSYANAIERIGGFSSTIYSLAWLYGVDLNRGGQLIEAIDSLMQLSGTFALQGQNGIGVMAKAVASNVKAATAVATAKGAKAEPKAPKVAKVAKAKGKDNGKAPESYADIVKQLDLPVAERKAIAIGRGGEKIVPRRFHIESDKLDALKKERAENPKTIPNPHNVGAYWLFVEALKSLGVNRAHSHKNVKAEMKKIGSAAETKDENQKTLWERFANKDGKSEIDENNKDLDGRIRQNAEVLQRLSGFTPYGLKLLQVGTLVLKSKGLVVDVLKGKGDEVCYRLNPDSAAPVNEFKRQRAAK